MSMHEVNLVPPSIADRVARGRASRRVMLASACIGTVALGIALTARWIDARSAQMLAAAREAGAPVIALDEEIAKLRSEQRDIAASVELQRSVGVAIPASGLVRAIAGALPAGALLEKIDLNYENVQGTNKKIRRVAKDTPTTRELVGEIAGIAADESDVNSIVDGLGALAPISQVSLESSRSREFRGHNAREFRVKFRVDLDRRWKLPEITAAGAAGAESAKEAGQ